MCTALLSLGINEMLEWGLQTVGGKVRFLSFTVVQTSMVVVLLNAMFRHVQDFSSENEMLNLKLHCVLTHGPCFEHSHIFTAVPATQMKRLFKRSTKEDLLTVMDYNKGRKSSLQGPQNPEGHGFANNFCTIVIFIFRQF